MNKLLLLLGILSVSLFTAASAQAANKKVLVAYFSHTQTTEKAGTDEVIQKLQPKAKVLKGLDIHRNVLRSNPGSGAVQPLTDWLNKLSY